MNEIEEEEFKEIIHEAFNFEPSLLILNKEISVLELFHGPTYSFKEQFGF